MNLDRVLVAIAIYFMFMLATTIGLMMIGLSYRIGVVDYGFTQTSVTLAISFFALLNGISRPIFGQLMDKKGFIYAAYLSLILIIIAALIALINKGMYVWLFVISFGLFWFNLGAWLSIVPSVVKQYYGLSNYTKRYGVIFTAYGLGAVLGGLLSLWVLGSFNEAQYTYIAIITLVLISMGILKWFYRQKLL